MVLDMPSEGRKETQDMTQAEFIDYLQENWEHKSFAEIVRETGKSYLTIRYTGTFLRLPPKGYEVNHIGERYGRLTLIAKNGTMATVKCDCGNTIEVRYSNLQQGRTRSCGCLRKEVASEEMKRKRKIWE